MATAVLHNERQPETASPPTSGQSEHGHLRILILNQAFYPDVVSSAQHASDLAESLSLAGHHVTVICDSRGYDNRNLRFRHAETWNGVRIIRVHSTAFGKSAKWRRIADFSTFITSCAARLLLLPRFDLIVAMTSPPLISFLAALAVPFKARRLLFWSLDLNPDQAINAGYLREESLTARVLSRLLRYTLRRADQIIALDAFMKDRIQAKGISADKVRVIPPWSHDDRIHFDPAGRHAFRARHGLEGKFVVMYSGNHSPCHPLDTLLHAALRLAHDPDIVFCFVGGGSEFTKLHSWARQRNAGNILSIPYQPLCELSASLSAADLHVVVMGNQMVGVVHPCKIYNILRVGAPFLYIGPPHSHITDIHTELPDSIPAYAAAHGDTDVVIGSILEAKAKPVTTTRMPPFGDSFTKDCLVQKFITIIEASASSRVRAISS